MTQPMHILSIEPSGAGGIAHYTYFLNRALAEKGLAIDLLTAKRWNYPLPDQARIHTVFNRLRTNPLRLWLLAHRLKKTARAVHWQSASHPRLLLGLMRILPLKPLPWVYTVHNVLPHEESENRRAIYRSIYRRCDGLIFHNRYSQNLFHAHFGDIQRNEAVIPMGDYGGLIPQERPASPPSIPTLLFFGNIRPYKGLMHLIRAFALIRQALPAARLHIVGQPLEDFRPYLLEIEALGLTETVSSTLEYVPDDAIPDYFRQASLVVLPYEHIDQSAALLLAMGSGKAVLASAVGGIPEVIQHAQNGFLVEPKNPAAIAHAVLSVIQDQEQLIRIGQNAARDVSTRFSWDTIADQTVRFYQQISDNVFHGNDA